MENRWKHMEGQIKELLKMIEEEKDCHEVVIHRLRENIGSFKLMSHIHHAGGLFRSEILKLTQ